MATDSSNLVDWSKLPARAVAALRRPIVIATGNPHKVQEMRAILEAAGGAAGRGAIRVCALAEVGAVAEPKEDHSIWGSFAGNARLKAAHYARATGRACVADDSGLIVDALAVRGPDGQPVARPGVISSHYSSDGEERGLARAERDAANNQRVLRDLAGVEPARRGARFVCAMALAVPTGQGEGAAVVLEAEGWFEGRIGEAGRVPRGGNGFGYDPLFELPPNFVRTSAELSDVEKNARSHRAAAGERLAPRLAALLARIGAIDAGM